MLVIPTSWLMDSLGVKGVSAADNGGIFNGLLLCDVPNVPLAS